MITPLDIQNKEFAKGVRGYKEEDVDNFLDLLTLDLEKLIDENQKLKDQVKSLNAELGRYKNSEGTVLETLEAAKSLMEDISNSAEKRAEILIKNATLDAQLIQREAKETMERLSEESNALRSRLQIFKNRFRNLLETELERFETLSTEIFDDSNMADLESLMEGKGMADNESSHVFDHEKIIDIQEVAEEERNSDIIKATAEGKTILNLRGGE
ncbi:MAG: DivIVA domain-containing protein [Anaerovoracaceae bacterium]|jgi:cell division initiation protein